MTQNSMPITIRLERCGDEDAIHELTEAAFSLVSYGSGTEGAIVRALRVAGDLSLSLVAEADDGIVGHVAFSPVTIDGRHGGWFGLGPIAVRRDRQQRGIGKALIRDGLARLRTVRARGCLLIGDPAIYRGSGFRSDGHLTYRDIDVSYVQWITFSGEAPHGEIAYRPAFDIKPEATA
jgi:putative acetyltransferase